MNAVERVREEFKKIYLQMSQEYCAGYETALCDIQEQLNKECGIDYEQ